MRNIWTIAKREYNQYFTSPIAYAVAVFFLFIVGIIFALNLGQMALNPTGGGNLPGVNMVTGPMAFLMVMSIPAVTMRLIADEIRMGTMELMLTGPLQDYELVIGKWLGAYLFMLTLIGVTLIYPLILHLMTDPGIDQMLMVSSYLGIILLTGAFLSIGVGISALFSNQIAAFFTTIAVFVVMWWLIGAPANILTDSAAIFRQLDMANHFYQGFNTGVVNLSGVVYYISIIIFGLTVGTTAVETRRWR